MSEESAGQGVIVPREISVLLSGVTLLLGNDHPAGSRDVADDVERVVDGPADHERASRPDVEPALNVTWRPRAEA